MVGSHPFIQTIEEIYDMYCSSEIIDFADSPSVLKKQFSKTQLTKLGKEYSRINKLMEDDIPSITKILNLDAADQVKKDLVEKFLVFIQVEKNSVEFFEMRDLLNDEIRRVEKKRPVNTEAPIVSLVNLLEESRGTSVDLPVKRRRVSDEVDSLRERANTLDTTQSNKNIILSKIDKLGNLSRTDGEYSKLKDYVDKILSIPFGINSDFKVTPEKVVEAKKLLEKHVMYNYEAKDEIINYLVNDSNHCVSLYGPPGTSKSTLVQKGLSEALGRPMRVVSLGGKKDATYLTGHSYTYEGAVCGRIIDILRETKVMNPIIYFDELDKISGKAINGVLTHLIDPSQNFDFHDNYFSGISFDLSKVLFIFSYNDKSELDLVVSDRIKHIQVKVLDSKQKTEVLRNITIPNTIRKFFGDDSDVKIKFDDECMMFISRKYTGEGMRGLIKDIEHIISRIKTLYFLREINDKKSLIDVKYGELEIDFSKEVIITSDMIKSFFDFGYPDESLGRMYT